MKTVFKTNFKLYRACWQEICDYAKGKPHNTVSERLSALLTFFGFQCILNTLLLIPIVLLISFASWVATWISLNAFVILSIIFLVWLLIDKLHTSQQVFLNPVDWLNHADFVVRPVLNQIWKRDIAKELLWTPCSLLGVGYYYALPEPLSDDLKRRELQRKLERKYSEVYQTDFAAVIQNKIITVTGDVIFIKP